MTEIPFDRADHLALFGAYEAPAVNIAAVCRTGDFVARAKALGYPPFAVCLHALAAASLDVPQFRWRLRDGTVETIENVVVSYTVVGRGDNLNFSTFPHEPDLPRFVARYLADREIARAAARLRLAPMDHRGYLFVTCLPWMEFTAIQHPAARLTDASIPHVAVGRFERDGEGLRFPLGVQAHHGLVDGLHIARYVERVAAILAAFARKT